MWQTLLIVLVLAIVLIYVIRHYVQVYRADVPTCSGCSGCCGGTPGSQSPRSADSCACPTDKSV